MRNNFVKMKTKQGVDIFAVLPLIVLSNFFLILLFILREIIWGVRLCYKLIWGALPSAPHPHVYATGVYPRETSSDKNRTVFKHVLFSVLSLWLCFINVQIFHYMPIHFLEVYGRASEYKIHVLRIHYFGNKVRCDGCVVFKLGTVNMHRH